MGYPASIDEMPMAMLAAEIERRKKAQRNKQCPYCTGKVSTIDPHSCRMTVDKEFAKTYVDDSIVILTAEDQSDSLEVYQTVSRATAVYPMIGIASGVSYCALGLAGETGEVLEHIKKSIRDDGGIITEERRNLIKKEMGDVLWYWTQLATECGLKIREIATENIRKLQDRKARGTLHGSGDER